MLKIFMLWIMVVYWCYVVIFLSCEGMLVVFVEFYFGLNEFFLYDKFCDKGLLIIFNFFYRYICKVKGLFFIFFDW